jgi:sterol desaturase/sphingolipid hydroxylase (fatty acid hydroxylase superfamily)
MHARALHALISFALLAAVFWPLERLFPARPGQPLLRPRWWTDALFFAGQYLAWSGAALFVLDGVSGLLDASPLGGLRAAYARLPFVAQALTFVALSDLCVYGFHRASHAWGWLWRFHAVHHTAERLDWLAAHREHPVDGILTQLAVNLPGILLGFPLGTLAWFAAFRGMWAIFIHSNVRLPLGPLRVLFGAPDLHHWHHARSAEPTNFANLAPWTDLLFGTYHRPKGAEDWELGLDTPAPRSYLGLLLHPLQRLRSTSVRPTSATSITPSTMPILAPVGIPLVSVSTATVAGALACTGATGSAIAT